MLIGQTGYTIEGHGAVGWHSGIRVITARSPSRGTAIYAIPPHARSRLHPRYRSERFLTLIYGIKKGPGMGGRTGTLPIGTEGSDIVIISHIVKLKS